MDNVQRLLAIEAIKQLKARYFRCLDLKDWAAMRDVFSADATAEYPRRDGTGRASGAAAICDFIRTSMDGTVSVHHGHMPEITLISPTEANGIWAMEDRIWWPQPRSLDAPWPLGGEVSSYHGFGHYHERYEFTDAWRIKSLVLKRIRIEVGALRT